MTILIVTSTNNLYKKIIFGLDKTLLLKLAQLRILKGSIEKNYLIKEVKSDKALLKLADKYKAACFLITLGDYAKEVLDYFNIKNI